MNRIFTPWNVDDNCRTISKLLQPVKLQIYQSLQDGNDEEAVTLYTRLLTTMCHQFMKDRHYLYIDSHYYPDIDCTDIFRWMQRAKAEGKFSAPAWQLLTDTLNELKQSETYWEYRIPKGCSFMSS